MKAIFIFAFFAILTLAFVSTDQKDQEQVQVEQAVKQSAILPEVNFLSRITFTSERIFLTSIIEKCFKDPYDRKNKSATIFFKSIMDKTIDLIPLKHKTIRQTIDYSSDKQDFPHSC